MHVGVPYTDSCRGFVFTFAIRVVQAGPGTRFF